MDVLRTWALEHTIDLARLNRVIEAVEEGTLALPGLAVQPFYATDDFPWAKGACERAPDLIAELASLSGRLIPHPESASLISYGYWRAFFLWRSGRERTTESHRAPVARVTTRLAPGGGEAGNAYFSVLGAGTRIKSHASRFNARLRCHVGLSIPQGSWIEVGGERRRWHTGECLIFCDALAHCVTNDDLHERAVFAFDFWHPGVTPVERAALAMLLNLRTQDTHHEHASR